MYVDLLTTDYRRGVTDGGKRVFAGRGISLPSIQAIAIVVVLGFAVGIAVGWGTGVIAERLSAPEPSLTPSPSPSPTLNTDVEVPPMAPITREFDDADALAGLTSLEIATDTDQTYTVVTTDAKPLGAAASVRWVRVEYENGLAMDGEALSAFVLDTLNDPRNWGARGRYEFVPTEGASDIRIVVASPYTTVSRCPAPHAQARLGAVPDEVEVQSTTADAGAEEVSNDLASTGIEDGATPAPSPAETTAPAPGEATCADRGLVVISQYDWAAGLASYGDDRTAARQYLMNHFVGHVLGESDSTCTSGRAEVMVDQVDMPEECAPNPWAWPDEPVAGPESSPEPSGDGDQNE